MRLTVRQIYSFFLAGVLLVGAVVCRAEVSRNDLEQVEKQVQIQAQKQKQLEREAEKASRELQRVNQEMIKAARQIQNNEASISEMEERLKELEDDYKAAEEQLLGQDQNMVKMTVGEKDRLDLKPLLRKRFEDLPPVISRVKYDRRGLSFSVKIINVGLDHADHITSDLYFLHRSPPADLSAVRSLYCLHSADILEFAADLLQFLGALDLKTDGQRRDTVFAGHSIDFQYIDISLREVSRHIVEKSRPVVGVNIDLTDKAGLLLILRSVYPGGLNDPSPVFFVEIDHIDAVRPVDRDAAASCHKADDLIAGNRIAAFGESYRYIVYALDDDGTLPLAVHVGLMLGDLSEHFLVRDLLLVILFVKFMKFVDDLTFSDTAVADCREDSVPLPESVLLQYRFFIFGFEKIRENIAL